jgi:hypothetical protein
VPLYSRRGVSKGKALLEIALTLQEQSPRQGGDRHSRVAQGRVFRGPDTLRYQGSKRRDLLRGPRAL